MSDASSRPLRRFLPENIFLRSALLIIWTYVGFNLAQFATILIVRVLLAANVPLDSLGDAGFSVTITAVVYILSLLVVVGVPYLFGAWPSKQELAALLGIDKRPRLMQLVWSPVAYVVYFFVAACVILAVQQFFPTFDAGQEQDIGFENVAFGYEYIAAFVALVICAPIAEELLFRGFLFGRLRERLAFLPATILVSLLFGFVHGQWNIAIDTFFLSLALCYLRETTGTIWPSILLHMIKNGVAFYFIFVQPVSIV